MIAVTGKPIPAYQRRIFLMSVYMIFDTDSLQPLFADGLMKGKTSTICCRT